jgi:CHAD domain-containing protein
MAENLSQDCRFEIRRIMRRLALAALRHEEGLFDPDDVEPVHQMRVAMNKLRLALACFPDAAPGKLAVSLGKQMRWFKDELAPVRDLDVVLALVPSTTRRPDGPEAPGVEFALEALRDERAAALEVLRGQTGRKRFDRFKERLAQLAGALKKDGGARPATQLSLSERVDERVAKTLKRLNRLFEKRRKALIDSFAPERLHALRIASKRLRYMLDFFQKHRPELYGPIHATLDDLHECAGKTHDLDVLAPRIEALMARFSMRESPEATARIEPGIDWLLGELHGQRRDLMRQFGTIWRVLSSEEFAGRLREAMEAAPSGDQEDIWDI